MNISINTLSVYGAANPIEAFPDMIRRGLTGFEMWGVAPGTARSLRAAMDAAGTHLTCFCTREWNLTDPSARGTYLEGLRGALEDAAILRCPALITQVGSDTGADRVLQHQSILDGLRACVPMLEAAGVTLLVEPLNNVKDHKGYYLTDSNEGFDLIRAVGSPFVKLLFDIYHQLHMGEPVMDRIREGIRLIGHFHVAGFPARDEKIWEGFDYAPVFQMIDDLGFDGNVGMELFPSAGSAPAFLDKLTGG